MTSRRNQLIYWIGGWIFDFTKIVTILIFLILIVHYFLFTILVVKGTSMLPSYLDGDITLVNRVYYRLHEPSRGEAIALYFPGELEKKFIKRVMGIPGDEISIRSGFVSVNGEQVKEPFLSKEGTTFPDMTMKLEQNEFFVLGDNREVSSDSRIWGPLPREYVIGLVSYRYHFKKSDLNPLPLIKRNLHRLPWL